MQAIPGCSDCTKQTRHNGTKQTMRNCTQSTMCDATQSMVVILPKRPPIAFDVLSVDIGITPSKAIPGSSSIATPVKPISG